MLQKTIPISFVLIPLIVLIGCHEPEKDLASTQEILFSNTIFHYDSIENGRLIKYTDSVFMLSADEMVFLSSAETRFMYNEKGLLVMKITEMDQEVEYFTQFFYYPDDSLRMEIMINHRNDTLMVHGYGYFPDGRKPLSRKSLIRPLDWTETIPQVYDTIQLRFEYIYDGDKCLKKKNYDRNDNLMLTISYEYVNGSLQREAYHSYTNNLMLFEKEKVYSWTKSHNWPDYFLLDFYGDTIGRGVYQIKNDSFKILTESEDYETNITIKYFENNRKTAETHINTELDYVSMEYNNYDDNGRIISARYLSGDLSLLESVGNQSVPTPGPRLVLLPVLSHNKRL